MLWVAVRQRRLGPLAYYAAQATTSQVLMVAAYGLLTLWNQSITTSGCSPK
jgi:hypothetical protein